MPEMQFDKAVANFIKAINKGLIKTMSKMGISTVQSYRGAQIFEAVGLDKDFVDHYFTWTASRIGGIGLDVVATETVCATTTGSCQAGQTAGPGMGWRIPMAARRRIPPVQPGNCVQITAFHAYRAIRHLQGIHQAG